MDMKTQGCVVPGGVAGRTSPARACLWPPLAAAAAAAVAASAARSPHHFFTDSSQILSNGSTAGSTPVPHMGLGLSLPHSLDMLGLTDMTHPPLSTSPLAGQSGQSWRRERAHWSSSRPSLSPSRRLYKS